MVTHNIVLNNTTLLKLPYRRIPHNMYDEVRHHINEMLEAGVIRESKSNYSSNVVLVRKSLRFCIDSKTKNDCYNMLLRFDVI